MGDLIKFPTHKIKPNSKPERPPLSEEEARLIKEEKFVEQSLHYQRSIQQKRSYRQTLVLAQGWQASLDHDHPMVILSIFD